MLADLLTAFDGARTLLIDGRSGSGKSSLAAAIAAARPGTVVVRLDDIYPGWDGLQWASDHVRASLLEPRAQGDAGRWRAWNWAGSSPADWSTVTADSALIVEGVGALTPANRALADLAVWVDAPDDVRKRRALARDGATYVPHWDRWAAHEDRF
ncbi:hypothetical protein, partial [Microbacterium fluvii]